MKSVLFLASVLAFAKALDQALVDETFATIQEYGIECIQSENASDADMEAMMDKKPPVTHEGKCVLFCVSKKLNLMKSDGSFAEGSLEWFKKVKADDPEFYAKMIDVYGMCQEKIKDQSDPCEKALNLVSCVAEEGKKAGLEQLSVF